MTGLRSSRYGSVMDTRERRSSADLAEALTRLLPSIAPAGWISAYLFGSHAEGRARRESDVDIGVLLRYDLYPSARAF